MEIKLNEGFTIKRWRYHCVASNAVWVGFFIVVVFNIILHVNIENVNGETGKLLEEYLLLDADYSKSKSNADISVKIKDIEELNKKIQRLNGLFESKGAAVESLFVLVERALPESAYLERFSYTKNEGLVMLYVLSDDSVTITHLLKKLETVANIQNLNMNKKELVNLNGVSNYRAEISFSMKVASGV